MLAIALFVSFASLDPPPGWAVTALKAMKAPGLLVGYPDGLHSRPIPTRYECAIAVGATITQARSILLELYDADITSPVIVRDVVWVRSWIPHLIALDNLHRAFKPELRAVEMDFPVEQIRQLPVDALALQLRLLTHPFTGRPQFGH